MRRVDDGIEDRPVLERQCKAGWVIERDKSRRGGMSLQIPRLVSVSRTTQSSKRVALNLYSTLFRVVLPHQAMSMREI